MQNNKTAFLTGGSGGIGQCVAEELLQDNWQVIMAVRKYDEMVKKYAGRNVEVIACADLGNFELVNGIFRDLRTRNVVIDELYLTAGAFEWDNDMRLGDKMKPAEQVARELLHANLTTKETVWIALQEHYKDSLKAMLMGVVGSHAATFAEDDFRRINVETGFKEEGYILSMVPVSTTTRRLLPLFKGGYLYEAPLIDTEMARKQFNKTTIGHDPDWATVLKPRDAAKFLIQNTRLAA